MSQGFLRSVPDAPRSSWRWAVLPASVAAHALGAVAFLVIPLTAHIERPPIHAITPAFMPLATDVPAVIPKPRGNPDGPTRSAVAAPTQAPDAISGSDDPPPVSAGAGATAEGHPGVSDGVVGGLMVPEVGAPAPPEVPAPPRVPPQPVPVGGNIRIPKKIAHRAPEYPSIARTAGVQGTVILEAVISEGGHVDRVKILRSVPLLDAAAIDAVSHWRYTPTLLNGVPVPVLMTITVTFSLRP